MFQKTGAPEKGTVVYGEPEVLPEGAEKLDEDIGEEEEAEDVAGEGGE